MFFKTLCLLLALAVVAYGLPYDHYDGGNIDPGFSRYPNQGFGPDPGFNGHGQGGFVPGYPNPGAQHYGAGESHSGHKHGYQEHGY